jgi:predicted Fe-Mo cluster-binding NifX family protein
MVSEAMPNDAIAAPGGAGIQAAQAVVNKGVDVLISGNIGPNAFQVLSAAGVKVAIGAYGTVKEAVEMYKSGKLRETGASSVAAHAGMGIGGGQGGGRGRGMGIGRGMGTGIQQSVPSQSQASLTSRPKEEELEQLTDLTKRLEKELEDVKRRLEQLKRR